MSSYRKDELETKLTTLIAEKKVLDWKNRFSGKPTEEDYETQKRYYDGLWQQNQDAIINALNNGTLKIGTDEWRAIMNKSGDLRGQKEAFHMGKMGMLDGERAQEASEQTTVPAGHEYAFGTGGVQPSIYTGDGRRRRETNQPAENNVAAGHEYAAGTGGVAGNYKPREIRDAERAVDVYNNAFDRIGQLTGESDPTIVLSIFEQLSANDEMLTSDSLWGQAAKVLDDAEGKTGLSYQDAIDNYKAQQKSYDNQKKYTQAVENAYIYKYATMLVKEITGREPHDIMANIAEQRKNGPLTGIWADAYEIMQKAEEITGVSLETAVKEKSNIDGNFERNNMSDQIASEENFQKVVGIKALLDTSMISIQEAQGIIEKLGLSPETMDSIKMLIEFDNSSSTKKKLEDAETASEPSNKEKDVMLQTIIGHANDDRITEIIKEAYGNGDTYDLSNVKVLQYDMYRLTDREARDLYKQEKTESDIMTIAIGVPTAIATSILTIPAGVAVVIAAAVASSGVFGAIGIDSAVKYNKSEEPVGGIYFEYNLVITNYEGTEEYIQGRIAPTRENNDNPLDYVYHFTN